MKYRSDIDGLRAIAIFLVLIYHGGLPFFSSGFIGVDLFFVISGFLISRIIYQSLDRQCFSFIDFYSRRLWRLQPLLLCFIGFTSLALSVLFLPDDLMHYASSARKTSLFLSNVFFNHTTTGYFSPDTQQLPLLHTWSLSIEWQCYLVLPLVLYALQRCFSKKKVLVLLYGLMFISFLMTLYSSQRFPAQTYYLFSSRLFEFLIGACTALTPWKFSWHNAFIRDIPPIMALTLLFYIASLNHILLGYPNGYTLTVCLAAALLLVWGEFYTHSWAVRFLSSAVLVFIGRISYSLYIWHWPIFAALRYQGIEETPLVLMMAFGLIVLLAYCSWRYIEQPAKKFKNIPFAYTAAILLIIPICIVHGAAYFVKANQGFPQRFNSELAEIYRKLKSYDSANRPLCISNSRAEASCFIGADMAKSKKGLMIGDSFSNHYWGFMDVLARAAGVSLLVQGTSSCITLPGIYLYDWWHFKNQVYQECREQTERYYHMITRNHYDYVIIGQLWSNYIGVNIINKLGEKRSIALSKKRLRMALIEGLNHIIASGATPVLMQSTAVMKANYRDCFFRHIKLRQPYEQGQCRFTLVPSKEELWVNRLIANMQKIYPQLIVIDPKLVQCNEGNCVADINGVPVYRDIGHITDYASYQFGRLYLKKWGNPLG